MDSILTKQENGKIINSFCVVGLDENKMLKFTEEKKYPFIQNIDAVQIKNNSQINPKNKENEQWILLNQSMKCYLRIQYSKEYNNPITRFRIIECLTDPDESILLPKKFIDEDYRPIEFTILDSSNLNQSVLYENYKISSYNKTFVKIPAQLNLKEKFLIPAQTPAIVILITRNINYLPLKKITVNFESNVNRFSCSYHESPYISKYIPEILCNYPQDNFIYGIAMFNFPNGISITTKKIKNTWHNFTITDENLNRKYGASFVFYEKMDDNLLDKFIPNYQEKGKEYYCPKAICLLSYYPYFYNMNQFLKQLYQLQITSNTKIPLERAICSFVDSLYLQSFDKSITFNFGEELNFYRIPYYGYEWDSKDECLNTMFHLLSYENILIAWEAVLLEKKIFILSTSKQALIHICMGLITLIFPFQWVHTFIPLLPEKLKLFASESIFPEIMGINFPVDDINFPKKDSIIINVDKNQIQSNFKFPLIPDSLKSNLMKKLNKIKSKYNIDNPNDTKSILDSLDYVELYKNKNKNVIDSSEIRDIFYEFFIQLFKNYEKYFDLNKLDLKEPVPFLKYNFLADFKSFDDNSFLNLFTQTTLFEEFIESFKYIDHYSSTAFFLESIKNGKKLKYYLADIKPNKKITLPEIDVSDLNNKIFNYKSFPNTLDESYYLNRVENNFKLYRPRIKYTPDEWCYDIQKLNNRDWCKFLMYSIYEIWYTLFSYVIHFYDDKISEQLMDCAIDKLNDLIKLKINPSKKLLTKLVKSCGRNSLAKKVTPLFKLIYNNIKSNDTKLNSLFHNAFMNGLYTISENINKWINLKNSLNANLSKNPNFKNLIYSSLNLSLRESMITEMKSNETEKKLIEEVIFLTYEMCPICIKSNKNPKKITIEQILAGFSRDKSDYLSVCPNCFNKIFPKIYFLKKSQQNLEAESVNFYSPLVLVKEIENIIENDIYNEACFYLENFSNKNYKNNILFWNLVFYFKLFNLPTFVLYIDNDEEQFIKINKEIFDIKNNSEQINFKKNIKQNGKKAIEISKDFDFENKDEKIIEKENILINKIQKILENEKYNSKKETKKNKNNILNDIKTEFGEIIEIFVNDNKIKLYNYFLQMDNNMNKKK